MHGHSERRYRTGEASHESHGHRGGGRGRGRGFGRPGGWQQADLPPADDAARTSAAVGRIGRFREDTREARMQIADEAEGRYGRKIAWGARIGDSRTLFTHLAVPVMTRLRQDERRVLDTLVDAGVARSRSEALSWCVRLVGEHTDEWLASLRNAMTEVDKVRAEGPGL